MAEVSTYLKALIIRVDGIVQGVGFRPFVYRLARKLDTSGWVINRNDGVLIHAQGEVLDIDRFTYFLKDQAPPAATISSVVSSIAVPCDYERFTIKKSRQIPDSITGISPDIAVCRECREDLKNQPHRISYPLINCTNCGPRFSIISRLPYDRVNTSMDKFAMCPLCEQEYMDPDNRRFHAQPVACNRCGPIYSMVKAGDHPGGGEPLFSGTGVDFEEVCRILENGGVATIKGTGGYNLVCDAMNLDAVERIREIKGRERKPFAVMFRDAGKVKEYCMADDRELELLQSWRAPVVILISGKAGIQPGSDARTTSGSDHEISSGVSGKLNTVGAILPYLPFHHLLFDRLKLHALVFTSANTSGDPIVFDDMEAVRCFVEKSDVLICHDRDIINPVDDSVCRMAGGNIQILRRARGYVPEMIKMLFKAEGIFAAGSDLNNTFAIGRGNQAILSQHTGDLEHYDTFRRYRQTIDRFITLFNFKAGTVACDLHPGYHSVRFAVRLASETGSRLIKVQHHHAHIASCMAEHGLEGPVIGVCFDGTGYGDDGNIWGSEFMICDYSGYDRQGHFSYIPLPGGDTAIREPWRIALACLRAIGHRDTEKWIGTNLNDIPAEKIDVVDRMIAGGINSPLSCGAGRLFDAVAALTGVCREASYDGEAPMLLESQCHPQTGEYYRFSDDTLTVIEQVMSDLKRGTARQIIASRFHNGMARAVLDKVSLIHKTTGIDKVVLSGGVFQNSYLLNRVLHMPVNGKIRFFINEAVPVNDGGLALGQLAVAAEKTEKYVP
jgi:hydrogenase maturation protein HypF